MLDQLRESLARNGQNALLVVADHAADPDLAPFVGGAHLRASFLLVPAKGLARLGFFSPMEREEAAATGHALLTPEMLDLPRWTRAYPDQGERLAAVLGQALLLTGIPPGELALAGHAGVGRVVEACRLLGEHGFRFGSGHELVLLLRKRKGEVELARARRAAAGAMAAFKAVAGMLATAVEATPGDPELVLGGAPLTVGRLRAEVAHVVSQHLLEQPDGNIVAPAEEGAVPHNAGHDERRLRAAESVIVDLYPKGLVFADATRTFCVGTPPEPLARAHDAVLGALALARSLARPGARGFALQSAVCDHFRARGYPVGETQVRGYVHGLGHGVGLELHELPSFKEQAGEAEGRLEMGDVFTLEPGLYDPEAGFGVRVEDLVYLAEAGLETLTPMPTGLDPRAWLESS